MPYSELVRRLRGEAALFFGRQSPWPAIQAWEEWSAHLALSPGKQAQLWHDAAAAALSFWQTAFKGGDQAEWRFPPMLDDRRFRDPAWSKPPFTAFAPHRP